MDFEFAPSFNRSPNADLVVYGSTINGHSKAKSEKACALACQFSSKVTAALGWVPGDRVTARWSAKDKALTFVRVGVDDPTLAYKVSFYPPKKKVNHARVRLGCPAEALTAILEGKPRMTLSMFEASGNSVTFVAT